MDFCQNFDRKNELRKIKTESAVRRLNIACKISVWFGLFKFLSEIMTNGIFCDAEGKVTDLISYGSLIYLREYINSNKSSARIISMVYGEMINLILIYFAYVKEKQYSVLWTQLAPFIVMYYQSYLIETKLGVLLISTKHTFIWVFSGYYFSQFHIKEFPLMTACISGIFVMMIIVIYLNQLQDIDLCKSGEASRENLKKLDSLLESIPKSIFVINEKQELLFCNTQMKNIMKEERNIISFLSKLNYYKRYEIKGKSKNVLGDIQKTFRLGLGNRTVFGITELKGEFTEWESKLDQWENNLVLIVIGHDITNLLQLKQDSQENKNKSSMLRTVSHELRTPTNSILAMAQCLLETENLPEIQKEKLNIISSSCNYLLCIINDLLDFTQISAGCLKIVKVSFNISTLLKECLKIFEVELMKTSISTELVTKSEIPEEVKTDPYRLKQILINLLSNSRKFTKIGKISIIVNIKDRVLTISCKDTGIGIDETEIGKLFKVFGKVDDQSNNPQGSGLGLYISNMLVRELGGEGIKLKSSLGRGSKFTFSIPIEVPGKINGEILTEVQSLKLSQIESCVVKGKTKVLIVDDTYFNVLSFFQFLQPEGIMCSYALNGSEALVLVKEHDYDCIIMDVDMPVMDGFETTEKLNYMLSNKELKKLPPIIGATAYDSEFIQIKCKNVGMNDVIFKPCTKTEVLLKVNQWIKSNQFM